MRQRFLQEKAEWWNIKAGDACPWPRSVLSQGAPARGTHSYAHFRFLQLLQEHLPRSHQELLLSQGTPREGPRAVSRPEADLAGQGQTFEIGTPKSQKEFYRKMREQVALNADDYVDKYRAAVDKWIAEARQKKI